MQSATKRVIDVIKAFVMTSSCWVHSSIENKLDKWDATITEL